MKREPVRGNMVPVTILVRPFVCFGVPGLNAGSASVCVSYGGPLVLAPKYSILFIAICAQILDSPPIAAPNPHVHFATVLHRVRFKL